MEHQSLTQKQRILAVTAAGDPIPRAFARLVAALREAGAEVIPLPVPKAAPKGRDEAVPSFSELKRLARDLVSTLRRDEPPGAEGWLVSQLREVEGTIDAVVTVDPAVAQAVFPKIHAVWPQAVRVAVDGDYHLDPEWRQVDFDDLVVPDPMLAGDISRVRAGHARVRDGGPLAGGDAVEAKTLSQDKPQVVVSFARLDPGDVDPLLFQLSLAKPERFELLLLASGRTGVDELVRTRAGGYGLSGKRAKAGADPEPWIRGAAALIGHPAPEEAAAAVVAGIPQLIFSPSSRLSAGDRFLVDHRVAIHAEVPVTIAVHIEGLLPGGADREAAEDALAALEPGGGATAAAAVLDAARQGRPAAPAPRQSLNGGASAWSDDDLEDIGGPEAPSSAPAEMSLKLRRAYLREIILKQGAVDKQLARAQGGLATWQRRVRLATTANDHALAAKARPRVEGLRRIVERLAAEGKELAALRHRFASREQLTAADRAAASRFMSPETAARLDRGDAPDSAFTHLELEDALRSLKKRMWS